MNTKEFLNFLEEKTRKLWESEFGEIILGFIIFLFLLGVFYGIGSFVDPGESIVLTTVAGFLSVACTLIGVVLVVGVSKGLGKLIRKMWKSFRG